MDTGDIEERDLTAEGYRKTNRRTVRGTLA